MIALKLVEELGELPSVTDIDPVELPDAGSDCPAIKKPKVKKDHRHMTDQIKQMDLSNIVAEDDWNTRTPGWENDHPDETVATFTQLKESIKDRGIETPLVVAPMGGRSKKVRLIAGYRRHRAASEIQLKKVPVIVRTYETESMARSANLRENVEREDLNVPDLTYGIKRLIEAFKEEGELPNQRTMAASVGISQGYYNTLAKIATGLSPKLLQEWREATYDFPYREVAKVAQKQKSEQPEAWKEMVRTMGATSEKKNSKKLDGLKKKAAKIGELIAWVHWLNINPKKPDFDVEFPFDDILNGKYTAAQKRAMAKAAQHAYEEVLTEDEEEEAAE